MNRQAILIAIAIGAIVAIIVGAAVALINGPAIASTRPPVTRAFPSPKPYDCGSWGCFPTFPNPPGSGWEEMLVQSNVTSTLCLDAVNLTNLTPLKAKQCNGSSLSQDWWVKITGAGQEQLAIWNGTTWLYAGFSGGAFKLKTSDHLYLWSNTGAVQIFMNSAQTYWMNTPPSAGTVVADATSEDDGWILSSLCFTDADCTT